MTSLIDRAITYQRDNGTISLLRAGYRKAVSKILMKKERKWFGIIHPSRVRAPKIYLEELIPFYPPKQQPDGRGDRQWGEIYSHRNYTQNSDDVLIVGGGSGISTVAAAQEVGDSGSVHVYEPGKQQREIVKKTTDLNHVSDRITMHNAIVGEGLLITDESDNIQQIPPQELPDCDVLELDCEGAELGILKNLNVRPRVITVEIHNGYYPEEKTLKAEDVINVIHDMGYVIQEKTANGDTISESEFQDAVDIRSNKTPSAKDWYRPPKIIATQQG